MLPLLLSLSLLAADPPPNAGPVRLPAAATLHAADPKPTPGPDAPAKLGRGQRYVIDSKVECVVRTHPAGLVTVAKKTGPRDITANFSDGTGDVEDRTYAGPFVYVVTGTHTGRVEIDVIPVGLKGESEIVSAVIDVDAGGQPQPPQPGPGPAPLPTPGTAPIAGDGFKVLIVYEAMTEQVLPAAQQAAIYGKKTRDFLNAKCAAGESGKPKEWRIFDQNTPMDGDTKTWKDAMKRPRTSVPWLVVSNGTSGFEGPLPTTDAEITAILTQFGGK